jgi:hypothetical protein
MQVQIGMGALAWQPGAIKALRDLTVSGYSVGIIDPFTSASLIRGMLIPFALDTRIQVFGPDELGQVGLDGILWETLVRMMGGHPNQTRFVSPHPMHKALLIRPPANLSSLPALLAELA